MRITGVETLQADAGWRLFSFLKISTDDGITGWSEYNESFGSAGLSAVIDALAPHLIGKDPLPYERIVSTLHVFTRQSRGGLNHQAIAAIENALLDIKGQARSGCRSMRCSAGRCASAFPCTGRISGRIACATPP